MISKITPLNFNNYPVFTGNKVQHHTQSSSKLDYGKDIFINSDEIITKPPVDIKRIEKLNISHFRIHDESIVSGVTLAKQNPDILQELKEAGIETIVDFRHNPGKTNLLSKKCNDTGLDYINFKLKNNLPVFNNYFNTGCTKEEFLFANKKFVNELSGFMHLMNKGKLYISCLLGLHRTDLALTMNYLLNPDIAEEKAPLLSHMHFENEANTTNKYINSVKNLYKNIVYLNQTSILKLPDKYDDILRNKIANLTSVNKLKI